ncbi:putative iron transferase [Massariosphaeria phaeospora]|uniref:Putative iron transferase n=1 Tax=Massariosphaeria phaeospora TaxID=100035 RepID=A0A7C8MIH8_9PLEO|nr:putative iron transferase [Massariosphaeria phaeospora]
MPNVFAVPVFFICFRECLETSIIVSVLLAFLKQTLGPEHDVAIRKKLTRQVYLGILSGLLICLLICAGIIASFYTAGKNAFEAAEHIWEGVFGILASLIITVMGAALLRVSKLQDKWRLKITKVLEKRDDGGVAGEKLGWSVKCKRWAEKYAMFILPFVTVLREGIEAVLFIAGVGLGLPATSFPLAVICGLAAGALVGYLIYKGGNHASLQLFLVVSTCFLYLVAAGLFSKGVWNLEQDAYVRLAGEGAVEAGTGPGSYDIRNSVWHVNCCSPDSTTASGWGIFNSLFGWQNSATYGSVISYNVYWLVVILGFLVLGFKEREGRWPLLKGKSGDDRAGGDDGRSNSEESESGMAHGVMGKEDGERQGGAKVREVRGM